MNLTERLDMGWMSEVEEVFRYYTEVRSTTFARRHQFPSLYPFGNMLAQGHLSCLDISHCPKGCEFVPRETLASNFQVWLCHHIHLQQAELNAIRSVGESNDKFLGRTFEVGHRVVAGSLHSKESHILLVSPLGRALNNSAA